VKNLFFLTLWWHGICDQWYYRTVRLHVSFSMHCVTTTRLIIFLYSLISSNNSLLYYSLSIAIRYVLCYFLFRILFCIF
jgi:hypothetical protein